MKYWVYSYIHNQSMKSKISPENKCNYLCTGCGIDSYTHCFDIMPCTWSRLRQITAVNWERLDENRRKLWIEFCHSSKFYLVLSMGLSFAIIASGNCLIPSSAKRFTELHRHIRRSSALHLLRIIGAGPRIHYSDVTWMSWRLKPPATKLFV